MYLDNNNSYPDEPFYEAPGPSEPMIGYNTATSSAFQPESDHVPEIAVQPTESLHELQVPVTRRQLSR